MAEEALIGWWSVSHSFSELLKLRVDVEDPVDVRLFIGTDETHVVSGRSRCIGEPCTSPSASF